MPILAAIRDPIGEWKPSDIDRNGPLTRPEKDLPKFILVLQLFLSVTVGLAQESAPNRTANPTPEQKRIGVLLDRISSLPPEYKADLGFTILDTATTSLSPAQQQALLDEIFRSAVRARYPYGMTQADTQVHSDLGASLMDNSQ